MMDFFETIDPDLYDRSMPCVVPGLGEAQQVRRAAFAALAPEGRAWIGAEIGIGTGSDAATLFRAHDHGLLYGIDSSASLTAALATRRRLPDPALAAIDVELVPAPFDRRGSMAGIRAANPDGIDFVTSAFAIHNIPPERQQTALDNAAHILKPGGHFLYLDLISFRDPALEAIAHQADIAFIRDRMTVPRADVDPVAWHDLQQRWLEHYRTENFLAPLEAGERTSVTDMVAKSGFAPPVTLYRNLHTTLLLLIKR